MKLAIYQHNKSEERSKLKEKGKRIVNLFPKYLGKTGNK